MEVKKFLVPGPLYSTYQIYRTSHEQRVFLLLHGYGETGDYFYSKISRCLPQNSICLAVNGPFFVPFKTEEGYRAGYSWYFYSEKSDEYIIDMKIAVQYLQGILKFEKLDGLALTVIGYSQGGYLAPFIGLEMPHTQNVIGLNSQFLADEFETPPFFHMISMNGKLDEIVSSDVAVKAVDQLKQKGFRAESILVENGNHRLSEDFLIQLEKIIQKTHV